MSEITEVLFTCNSVNVFKIPPQKSSAGHKCSEWEGNHIWTGRLRVVSVGQRCDILLEDKTSGELFARCPVDIERGLSVEPAVDSSRYFVLRIEDDKGRRAFVGLGFDQRSDAFDFKLSLSQQKQAVARQKEPVAQIVDQLGDLGMKEGQSITITVGGIGKKSEGARTTASSSSSRPLVPPPATSVKPAPAQSNQWVGFDS